MDCAATLAAAFISPFLDKALDYFSNRHVLDFAGDRAVSEEVKNWEIKLNSIRNGLSNVDEQHMKSKYGNWLTDIRILCFDMEDILADCNIRAESKATGSSKSNRLNASEIKAISLRLQLTEDAIKSVNRESNIQEPDNTSSGFTEPPHNIYGRNEDQRNILDLVNVEGESVIYIVGMGGVGKTTLAKLVYNLFSPSLQFNLKAWVHVGLTFDALKITNSIVKQLGGVMQEDLNSLQLELKKILSEKKSLVVLDDVWMTHEDHDKWATFHSPFSQQTLRTRIIITTRNQCGLLAKISEKYPLGKLSDDSCNSILAYHESCKHSHFEDNAEDLAKMCDGLPLAAKALGVWLRTKENIYSWESLLNSKIWEEKNLVLPNLEWSYYSLSPNSRRCFGYMASFPKKYVFNETEVVSLWVAENFVKGMVDGQNCFRDLSERSMFQKRSSDESLFVMNDLMIDLARSLSGEICFNLDDEEETTEKQYEKVRHLTFTRQFDMDGSVEIFDKMKKLRTLLTLQHNRSPRRCLSLHVLEAVSKLERLRVLSLPLAVSELPTDIGSLKLLRFLDLSYAEVDMLPESLSELISLERLILIGCNRLLKLPKNFCNLSNLQLLSISGADKLEMMPLHMGKLKKLRMLDKFIVGDKDGHGITELLKIPNLQGRLHISQLQNVAIDEGHTPISKKKGIKELTLEWTDEFDGSRNEGKELEVCSVLKPHQNMTKLSILSYGGTQFPSWIPCLKKLQSLVLCNCRNSLSLPTLGQLPKLEELALKDMNGIKEVGEEFYGNVSSHIMFPSLKIMRTEKMGELKQWSCVSIDEGRRQVFPKLKELRIEDCPKLVRSLPRHLPALQVLKVRNCEKLEEIPNELRNLTCLTKMKVRGCPIIGDISYKRSA